jgi:hypothetical protein
MSMFSIIIIFNKVEDFHETWYDTLPQFVERKDGRKNAICSVRIGFATAGRTHLHPIGVRVHVSTHGETVPGGATNFRANSLAAHRRWIFCRLHDPWWEMRKWYIYLCDDTILRHRQVHQNRTPNQGDAILSWSSFEISSRMQLSVTFLRHMHQSYRETRESFRNRLIS